MLGLVAIACLGASELWRDGAYRFQSSVVEYPATLQLKFTVDDYIQAARWADKTAGNNTRVSSDISIFKLRLHLFRDDNPGVHPVIRAYKWKGRVIQQRTGAIWYSQSLYYKFDIGATALPIHKDYGDTLFEQLYGTQVCETWWPNAHPQGGIDKYRHAAAREGLQLASSMCPRRQSEYTALNGTSINLDGYVGHPMYLTPGRTLQLLHSVPHRCHSVSNLSIHETTLSVMPTVMHLLQYIGEGRVSDFPMYLELLNESCVGDPRCWDPIQLGHESKTARTLAILLTGMLMRTRVGESIESFTMRLQLGAINQRVVHHYTTMCVARSKRAPYLSTLDPYCTIGTMCHYLTFKGWYGN